MAITRVIVSLFVWLTIFVVPFSKVQSQDTLSIDFLQKQLKQPDDSSKVVALKLLCWEYRNIDASVALKYGTNALSLAQKLNIPYEEADVYSRLGVVKRNQSKYSDALECYIKSLEISKKNDFYKLQVYGYNNIADIYNRLDIFDKALEYVKLALKTSENIDDKNTLGYIYNGMGQVYQNQSKLDSAYACFKKSLQYREQIGFSLGVATSFLNIGNIHYLNGNYDSSLFYFKKSLEIYRKGNDQNGEARVYRHFGLYYYSQKEYTKAISYFKKCLEFNENFGNILLQKEASDGLKQSYFALGNIERAYFYQELASKINDSINTNKFIERITYLTESFNFEIKRKEEELLRKEQEALLSSKIQFQHSLIKFYVVIIILFGLLIFVVAYFYVQKNKNYKILNQQKLEIEELNSTKDKLFSIIGHDLKNPISSIIGISQLLKDYSDPLSSEQFQEMVENIHELGYSTYSTLDSLLNWARAQTNQVNLQKEKVSIRELAETVISNLSPTAKNKEININLLIENDFIIETDAIIISTVLRNLTTNAIKYSEKGNEITVSVSDTKDYLEVSVKDNGVGIPEETKKLLFSSISVESAYGTNNEKGTGLGLIICKDFLAKLGGNIWVESELGKGSTFTFSVPKHIK